ncbi:MAG: TMEM43 family protein [Rudaea sp.]
MKRRGKSSTRSGGVLLLAVAVVVVAGIGIWAWHGHRARNLVEAAKPVDPVAARDAVQRLQGRLDVVRPARDADLGISAPAVALLRSVAMYQWQEHCEDGRCTYSSEWSAQHVDSTKFRVAAGHANAPAPFASVRFLAGELRIGDVVIDPSLAVASLAPVEHPVVASALPPNLAATFSVVDGVLYAGGDPAHPRPGMIRISYRVVPAGEVAVSGVRRGNRLESP